MSSTAVPWNLKSEEILEQSNEWTTLSKALEKSSNRGTVISLRLQLNWISFVTLSMAVVVPCFDRKPDWRQSKRLKLSDPAWQFP
jgi:hypothetical protein